MPPYETVARPRRPPTGALVLLYLCARMLAVVDAVAVPGVLLFWVWRWPGHHGGFAGGAVATGLVWWGLRRAGCAVLAFDEYRWFVRHVVKLVLVSFVLQGVLLVQRLM